MNMVFKLLGVTFLTLFPSLLSFGHASLEGHSHGGRSEQLQAQILNNRNAAMVYWALESETGFQKVPEEFSSITKAQLRDAAEELVRENQSVKDWNQNPLKHYVSYAFQHLEPEEVEGFEKIVMSYVRSDFRNAPVNDALFDSGFFGGDLSLIQNYSDYVFSIMEGGLSLEELNRESAGYVEITAEIVKLLGELDSPSAHALGKRISMRLASKFNDSDSRTIDKKLSSILGSRPSKPAIKQSGTPLVEKTMGTPLEATTEESAEVTTLEPSEEPDEKPSNWWLCLVGLLVVVGGVGLLLRRKS
jgi:hypothetical protein